MIAVSIGLRIYEAITCFRFRISRSWACRTRAGRDLVVAVAVWIFLHVVLQRGFEAELRGESVRAL